MVKQNYTKEIVNMNEKNPYTRDFGTITRTFIKRTLIQDEIERSFINEITDDKVYFLVGQRGFGKSALLRAVKERVAELEKWIVVELRSNNENLIHELAASLYSIRILQLKLIELKFDFSLIGLGTISADKKIEITSEEIAVKKMLEVADKLGYKVLVALDEISNTKTMRDFCAFFNVCKGDKMPLYLIMDGLYKNTNALENVLDLTFLKRVPKLEVGFLNKHEMVKSYIENLSGISENYAVMLAELTKGYPYAFQLVGYYCWLGLYDGKNIEDDEFIRYLNDKLDTDLGEYVYSTLWREISNTEQKILTIIARYKLTKVADIRKKYDELNAGKAKMTSANFSKYRDKLLKMNLIRSDANTYINLALPRFEYYILMQENYT